jgi:hypothetical protein
VWTFNDTPNLVYAANLSGSWMAGIQGYETSGGAKGCFGAHKAGIPAAPAKANAEGTDPAVGRPPAKTEAKSIDPAVGR